MLAQLAHRIPAEGADADHDHHRNQGGHRDLADPSAQEHHHHQQQNPCRQRRQAPAPARLHVDDRLADHGAARHAADEARGNVGNALAMHSRFLLLGVSVRSSTMEAVIIDSSKPTTAKVIE